MTFLILLSSCTNENYAPVDNAWSANSEPKGMYTVQKGETLYAIAWRYDMDYRSLAETNHLSPPYSLYVGQVLSLKAPPPKLIPASTPVQQSSGWAIKTTPSVYVVPIKKQTTQQATSKQSISKPIVVQTAASIGKIQWIWPAKGKIIATYSPTAGRKGVDIAGLMGEPIYAAASGKVAYSGNGLRGYGNLIIIKHNDEFLSAYAHNQKLLVKDGQDVKAGQMIATMGNTESVKVMLHFEIREAGQSVNPLIYVKP